jgi:hypothetical protein
LESRLDLSIKENINWLGGFKNCFSIEKKTRTFIDIVLKSAFDSYRGVIYTDMECELKLFNELIKPDYQVMRQNNDNFPDTPLYVIEVKRTGGKKCSLLSELDQHFKQLRYICITHSLPFVNGVITDFKDWYFTRFDFNQEVFMEYENSLLPNSHKPD